MRGWYALALCAAFAAVASGCDNEGKIDGSDAGGSGGDSGSAGSSGAGGTGGSGGTPPTPPTPCSRDEDCDDGVYCNGVEACTGRVCRAGTAPSCDDGVACTVDRCDETRQACVSNAADNDGDGHLDATCADGAGDALGDDCDDTDSTRYPGALEVCDADDHDEDCDLTTFGRVDFDGDSYLNANCCNIADDATPVCGDDCDDANARVHPFNTESCDGLDNDCNGVLDHPTEDQDHDGFATIACGGTDCDDFDGMTYAGAMERCDGIDNDCLQGGGTAVDETDMDSDTFVSGVCMKMEDTDLSPGDCDEDRQSANPMRDELCNGKDDDCDGAIDEGSLDCSHAVKQVDASYWRTCATRVNGTVACWGANSDGQLGTGSDSSWVASPRTVLDPRDTNLQLSQVKHVSVGRWHACAVHNDGRVSCWGENHEHGVLGRGVFGWGVANVDAVPGLEAIAEVCTGMFHSCALREDGTVACWGDNSWGALGDGTFEDRASPVDVVGLSDVVDIDCDAELTCAVLQDGGARCWGDNRHHQLGDISTTARNTPVEVFGVLDAVQITTSRSHACARLRDGTAMCWGDNEVGQAGMAQIDGDVRRAATVVRYTGYTLTGIAEIIAGGGDNYDNGDPYSGSTCARLQDGRIECWGSNDSGQLGVGEYSFGVFDPPWLDAARFPVQSLPDAIQVSVGDTHSCSIAPDGTLRCWGGNQLLVGTFNPTSIPVVTEGL
jgi:alpha-tubulin suppressor-like RCC1 family protein